ncbi:MAG: CinA family nicotinamide mononucleotide deamidase-related protein [Hallerella succinigenes]|uniref:CinA family nicotinamide mononucleotide deamidase-related protein n=2 Tax=Hallerella TaxID=2815788 RepID=UPI0023F326BE|nr:CinA family nicotinamide mononucleotide deamidase-related protein [Hallerella succinigenes]MDD6091222.1 CinA family nicotinamide mononucleotide deamidase-related protein [Hallerella succinigenes]
MDKENETMQNNIDNKVAIVNLGTELTQGYTLNTNAHWMAGRLRDLGFEVSYEITLPDDASVWNATWEMIRKANVQTVILGGGLGPTEDDKTRYLVAETFKAPLEFHEECIAPIRAFIESKGWKYSDANKIQAYFPRGAQVLENPVGTAPGFSISQDGVTLFALPGVPFEAHEMFDRHIVPFLAAKGVKPFYCRELRLAGLFESNMAEMFQKVNFPAGVSWSSLPVDDAIIFRTYTRESEEVLKAVEKQLIEALDDKLCVVSTDGKSLPEQIVKLLKGRGETLSTAESCTGGMISSEMVNLAGVSEIFKGGACTYWNEAKEDIVGVPHETLLAHGAVSEETVLAMAEGARKAYHTDWAVATSGVAGPDGGTPEKPVGLVWMAVVSECKRIAFCKKFSGNRGQIRRKSVFKVLDALRRAILEENEQKSTCTKVQ